MGDDNVDILDLTTPTRLYSSIEMSILTMNTNNRLRMKYQYLKSHIQNMERLILWYTFIEFHDNDTYWTVQTPYDIINF